LSNKVLFVDDDPNILASFQRQLRKQFCIETALSGKEGLETVAKHGPYLVIVSDLRMPGMDGIQFLSQVRKIAPDSVRMMLTGNADLQTAIQAVNEGNIFRFLLKPCHPEILAKAISAGIDQYRLVTSERELLEKTLSGSIKVLTEVLSMLNPEAFGRASRISRYVKEIAIKMHAPDVWQLVTAALLSQIGCIILPEEILRKLYQGQDLTEEESKLFNKHPFIGSDLLAKIPRMQNVAQIIAYQEKHFDGYGIPHNSLHGKDIPLGARILKVVLDFDLLEASGYSKGKALAHLKERLAWYDPSVVSALEAVIGIEAKYELRAVTVKGLAEKMILAEDVRTLGGRLLITRGNEVSQSLIKRLRNFAQISGMKEPIRVLVPLIKEGKYPQVKQ